MRALFACHPDRSWGHGGAQTLVSRRPRRHGTLLFAHHCPDGMASSLGGGGDATLPARGNEHGKGVRTQSFHPYQTTTAAKEPARQETTPRPKQPVKSCQYRP